MAFADVGGNVLTQYQLQPWWEAARTYALTLMLAASLFLSYNFETVGAVNCRPFNTTSEDMEGSDTDFVNSVCVTDYNSALYTGTLNVVGTCLLMVIANWWLSIRRVRRALYSVRQADILLSETKYLPIVVEEIATEPWSAMQLQNSSEPPAYATSAYYYKNERSEISNIRAIRDAARKIWLRDMFLFATEGSSMNTLYIVSNFFSLICVSGLVFSTYFLGLRIDDLIFICTDPPAFSGLEFHTYTCVQGVSSQLTSFIVLYYLLGFTQAIVALGLLVSGISKIRFTPSVSAIQRTMQDNSFILELSKNSTELSEATQRLISISYPDLREKVIRSHEARKDTWDAYFNDLMRALNLDSFDDAGYQRR